MPLLFALAVGKVLINTLQPFIEASSTKGIYVRKANVLPRSDTQCWYTETLQEQVCLGNNQPIRIRFLPDHNLKISFHSPGLSQIEEESEGIEWWELKAASDEDSGSEDSGTSDESSNNCSDEDETDTETAIQFANTTLDPFRALKKVSQYCATLRLEMIEQESISDGKIATDSKVKVTKVDSANHLNITSPDCSTDQRSRKHHCDHEGCNYSSYWTGNLKKHKQIHLSADQRLKSPKVKHCDHGDCNYRTDRVSNLQAHKKTHLPADQRPKVYLCNHEGCNYRTDNMSHLKNHKNTHLPVDQRPKRPKVHQCEHEGCNYSTYLSSNLKKHKLTHLPADQRPERPKVHQCDHKGCNYRTDRADNLKTHKQIHLPADQRPKVHQCDHEDCNYKTDHSGNLKTHKQTHSRLKKPKRKAHDQLPSNKKRKKGDQE